MGLGQYDKLPGKKQSTLCSFCLTSSFHAYRLQTLLLSPGNSQKKKRCASRALQRGCSFCDLCLQTQCREHLPGIECTALTTTAFPSCTDTASKAQK